MKDRITQIDPEYVLLLGNRNSTSVFETIYGEKTSMETTPEVKYVVGMLLHLAGERAKLLQETDLELLLSYVVDHQNATDIGILRVAKVKKLDTQIFQIGEFNFLAILNAPKALITEAIKIVNNLP